MHENHNSFLPITHEGKVYFGGNQNWYLEKCRRSNGCGPVAAANITCYLARKDSERYGALYPYPSLEKKYFLAHMNNMYTYFRPSIFGEISLNGWTKKMENYAKERGVNFKRVAYEKPFTLEKNLIYLKEGLESDCPVATLNLDVIDRKNEFGWHWMIITEYYEDIEGNSWIGVSSWGKKYIINYQKHFKAMNRLLGGGLIYFK
ncbi:hypothetical protein SAMN00017405_1193 [Desulfonispora thiosulfatigenes DSM 11270]|uniref:Peptidase_C39 like family protein n=1 Tax=Desulfonispora thiosulfatigenes DSM 11270 TaxID=656914 RepID=A0A1W1V0H8_DESTI|nr:hypothetical protein [Desulfonispora thiosulfatigenes]SMB86800.1 hypothetical protein SAMN00017405_1193 [Desulfonispora thiosulfatigenes DSM 11270]